MTTYFSPASLAARESHRIRYDFETLCSSASRSISAFLLTSGDDIALTRFLGSITVRPGVRTRVVAGSPLSAAGLPEAVELRVDPLISESLLVVDDRIAATGHVARATAVREPALVTLLNDLFERVWAHAEPRPGGPDLLPSLTRRERIVLRMCAEGLTDEVVGRHLGLTSRTVRRHMANAMERIGAQSRFQAGIRAAKAGII
ncbi:hypothetical protein GCM10010517_09090 [Streptosporangium fragile]|uniref:HTH luxR-type domain-containing protein n=1 Tax=Streptosporangium fragile TaxID=46186 RepID=A0ABP6I9M1_9ACTN